MSVLLLAEHDNQHVKPATLSMITAAQQLSSEITVLVAGYHCESVAKDLAEIEHVSAVWLADNPAYEHAIAENSTDLITHYATNFSYIIAPATTFGKNILPRVAAQLDVMMLSDVIKIESPDTFIRPIYAGNALATVKSLDSIKCITFRTTAFDKAIKSNHSAPITIINEVYNNTNIEFVSATIIPTERPELTAARIIVSGGRALQSQENFKLIEQLAEKLGAAIGASRAAVDAGFVPNDYQVGQTGKVVAPELYIAVGISGAIQHIAGMKDSKVIVAINKDPDAPIFQVADYGLVGDLFTVLPELIQSL